MEYKLSAVLELRDKFTSGINRARNSLKNIGEESNKSNSFLRKTSDCLNKNVSALRNLQVAAYGFRAASAGLNFMKSAFTEYAALDQVLTKNKSIMGANREEAEMLKAQVRELGKTMPFTAKEVAEAQKYQAMAGYKTNEVLAITPKLLKLSIASGEDLAKTSDIITDNLDAFGMKIDEVDRLMDVMAATANNTNTSIGMLGEAYQYVGATSRNFDSFEEVNIMLGILANNGIKGAKAGRNLASVYARLSKLTPDMKEELAKTGTTLYDTNGKFKGLRRIIEESSTALEKMTEAQRNQWLATIAGTEGLKVWQSIAGYSAEGMKKVKDSVENAKGSVDKINEEMKNTPQNKIKELESAWENLKLTIAEGAAPAITEAIQDITKKVNELASSDTFSKENLENFFNTAISMGKDFLTVLEAISIALKPIIWAGKLGANIGKSIGMSFTPFNEKEFDEFGKIYEEQEKIQKMKARTFEEDERRKKLWIENKKREDAFNNKLYKEQNRSGMLQDYVKKQGIEGVVDINDEERYENMYYNIGGDKNS